VRATLSIELLLALSVAKLSRDLIDHIGLHDRCADCFWWRMALHLGYCVL
jgi:hypothetical protein